MVHNGKDKTVLVTGAGRGIGLGLAQRFLRSGFKVVATARNPDGARELWELERDYPGRVRLAALDVTKDADCDELARSLEGAPLDILVNNAGVLPEGDAPFERVSPDAMRKAFEVNVLGPLRVTQRLLPNLRAAPHGVVAMLTSKMGSIQDNGSGGSYAYRVSKAALNMLTKTLAVDFPKLTCIVLHPGWVQTDMGGRGAPLAVEESASGLFDVITRASHEHTGRFFDYRGKEIPW